MKLAPSRVNVLDAVIHRALKTAVREPVDRGEPELSATRGKLKKIGLSPS